VSLYHRGYFKVKLISRNRNDRYYEELKMINEPVHVTDAAFENTVLQSKLPVIVDFWAPWCGPCRMIAPTLEKLAKEMAGKVLIAKVNTDENPQWAMQFGVQGIPTMLFVADGKIVHRHVGALPEANLRDVVNQFLEVVDSSAS
jgi:thioredoxin 1